MKRKKKKKKKKKKKMNPPLTMSTDMATVDQFLHPFIGIKLMQERCRFLEDAMYFIAIGVPDIYNGNGRLPIEAMNEYMSSVRSQMTEALLSLQENFRLKKDAVKDGREQTLEMFKLCYLDGNRHTNAYQLIVPPIRGIDEATEKDWAEEFGGVSSVSLGFEAQPSVVGAFKLAKSNFALTCARLNTLWAVSNLVQPRYRNVDLKGNSGVRNALYDNLQRNLLDIMMFGSLLGGEAQAEALKIIYGYRLQGSGFCKMSVMEYLQTDNTSPGSYWSSTDEAFRADIEEKFKQLGAA